MNKLPTVSKVQKASVYSGLLATVFFLGCATKPPEALKLQLAQTDTSIAQAEQAGAADGSLAELQQAKDKRAGAQAALKERDYDEAMQLAKQAQVDAQFASRKSAAARLQKGADEVERGHDLLRVETERKANEPAPATPPIGTSPQ